MRYYQSGKTIKQPNSRLSRNRPRNEKLGRKKFRQYEEAAFLSFSNPYKRKIKTRPIKLKGIILVTLIFIWILLIFTLSFFRITRITIEGTQIIKESSVMDVVKSELGGKYSFIPLNHYFFVSTNNITKKISNEFPVNNVIVSKTFPNTLNISIAEKSSSVIYDNGLNYYLLDNNGQVIKFLRVVGSDEFIQTSIPTSSLSSDFSTSTISVHEPKYSSFENEFPNLPIIYQNTDSLKQKEIVINPKTISSILDFNNGIKKGSGIKIDYYKIDEVGENITAESNHDWDIIFTMERPAEEQLKAFWSVFRSSKPKEYIDLRIQDRIFWK